MQVTLDDNAGNRVPAKRAGASHLLTGLLHDDHGNRMSPSHVQKNDGRRYRYYVSQALLQHRADQAGTLPRVPAQVIEDLVADRARRLAAAPTSTPQSPIGAADPVRARFARVVVGADEVRLILAPPAGDSTSIVKTLPAGDRVEPHESVVAIIIPIRLQSQRGATAITGPPGAAPFQAGAPIRPLIGALVLAHR